MKKYALVILALVVALCFIAAGFLAIYHLIIYQIFIGIGTCLLIIWIILISRKGRIEFQEKDYSNVGDWVQIGGFLVAAQLTVIALIWDNEPIVVPSGIYTVTLLLMLSFVFFLNSIFANSKAHHILKIRKAKKKKDDKETTVREEDQGEWEKSERILNSMLDYSHFTFNMGYSFALIGFTILAYKYMIGFVGRILLVLFLPVIFFVVVWILLISYIHAKSPGRVLSELKDPRKIISFLLETTCLILIMTDFFEFFPIP
jgi:Flp pilus assembly protein TadB